MPAQTPALDLNMALVQITDPVRVMVLDLPQTLSRVQIAAMEPAPASQAIPRTPSTRVTMTMEALLTPEAVQTLEAIQTPEAVQTLEAIQTLEAVQTLEPATGAGNLKIIP
jgi:hypothetical protein